MTEAHDVDDDKGEEMEIEELMELNDVAIADRDGNDEEDGYNDHYDSKHRWIAAKAPRALFQIGPMTFEEG